MSLLGECVGYSTDLARPPDSAPILTRAHSPQVSQSHCLDARRHIGMSHISLNMEVPINGNSQTPNLDSNPVFQCVSPLLRLHINWYTKEIA